MPEISYPVSKLIPGNRIEGQILGGVGAGWSPCLLYSKLVAQASRLGALEMAEMTRMRSPSSNYREQSLKLHGMVCAKCGREFNHRNRQLLTVHHKDGNSRNNPPDGSNWENLCVYCHEDEHSRGLLGEYLGGDD